MKHETVMEVLDHLYKLFPYSVSRWVKDNTELHITLRDNLSSNQTKNEEIEK